MQPGDHLVSVQGTAVTGQDLDTVLQSVQAAPTEVSMKFYRGSLGDVINPRVFFDITIGGSPAGRVVCRLRKDVVPKTVEVRLLPLSWLRPSVLSVLKRGERYRVSAGTHTYAASTQTELPRAVHGGAGLRVQGLGLPPRHPGPCLSKQGFGGTRWCMQDSSLSPTMALLS